jgi:hypothetical protein
MSPGPLGIIDTKDLSDKDWRGFYKHMMNTQTISIGHMATTHTDINPMATSKDVAYINLMLKINILLTGKVIEPKEAVRLVSMLGSDDTENWTVAVECIKQKLSEL